MKETRMTDRISEKIKAVPKALPYWALFLAMPVVLVLKVAIPILRSFGGMLRRMVTLEGVKGKMPFSDIVWFVVLALTCFGARSCKEEISWGGISLSLLA